MDTRKFPYTFFTVRNQRQQYNLSVFYIAEKQLLQIQKTDYHPAF